MERGFLEIIVVLTADRACFERVQRISGLREDMPLWWLATDPSDLLAALYPATAPQPEPASWRIVGVILDLSSPSAASSSSSPNPQTLEIAWHLTDSLALQGTIHCSPMLVVSAEPQLEDVLRQAGIAVAAQIAPDADDVSWRRALEVLSSERYQTVKRADRTSRSNGAAIASSDVISLQPNLWLDRRIHTIIRDSRQIALTVREYRMLDLLLQAPGRYHEAGWLANQLTRPGGVPIDQHSVEQTICALRHKLGETGQSPRLLRTRRGIGYGIFPRSADMSMDEENQESVAVSLDLPAKT